MLIRLMNDVRDILEDSSSQWPVNRVVALLNQQFPPPTWTDRRVDNAKKTLTEVDQPTNAKKWARCNRS
jgi:hypothetical protein